MEATDTMKTLIPIAFTGLCSNPSTIAQMNTGEHGGGRLFLLVELASRQSLAFWC
ncbi:hypothetical protein M405DRAFT_815411 [Rhizopogon salebrosus TDB-379]|nr:hypothetical protein M405DRAFT_815411 [Rhizopogon salebrosus TDB-379]